MIDFPKLLQRAVQRDASDIHLKVGSPPYYRLDGELMPQEHPPLQDEDLKSVVDSMINANQKKYLAARGEVDFAFSERGVGRFRVNIFRQRGSLSIVMRRIKNRVQGFEELNLPPVTAQFARLRRGLVLITGTTGSGKSTTLSAIVDYINERRRCHIVTIEDPIEFMHNDRLSVVSQREVNIDTEDFSSALKSVLRQDPDVILIGEMRDLETFQAAMSAAETGHLVFSTLHTSNVMQTIDRILDLFPASQQDQVRSQLSLNLKAVMSMRLLPKSDGVGRVPACEVMFSTPAIRKVIKENRIHQLEAAIQQGREEGMQSFNESIYFLLQHKLVNLDDALSVSDNPEELQMMMQGIRLNQSRGGLLK